MTVSYGTKEYERAFDFCVSKYWGDERQPLF